MKRLLVFLCAFVMLFSFPFCASAEGEISVSAKSAVVICGDSLEVVFDKNSNLIMPMASTTKIMTALILAEQKDLSKCVTVTKEMVTVEGSSMGLKAGDSVSYRDLLYGMLLASGNDAANATAILLGGSLEGFAKMMNDKAKALGLKNTSFVTPSGLDDPNHYTTAYDLALLTFHALKNQAFSAACSSKSATLYYGNPPYKRSLTNHNKLLESYEGLIGVKTGYTKKSGRCLVTAAKRDGVLIIAVTLNAPDDWNDHKKMLDLGFEKSVLVSFPNNDIDDILPIISGDCDSVRIRCESVEFTTLLSSARNIETKILLPTFEYAPLAAGETVGRIEYYVNGKLITSANIYSVADVNIKIEEKTFLNKFWENFISLWKYS